jgi:hypothetical protein
VGKERVPLERLNYRNHPIMAAHPKIVSLGDVMG